MSLSTGFHVIYGYEMKGNKLMDDITKYTSEQEHWFLPNGIHIDDFEEQLLNDNKLCLIEDRMSGEYSYLGIPIITNNDYTYSEWSYDFDPKEFIDKCSDEKLDKLIQEKIPFIVDNEYDIAGLLYGQLPKLYFVKTVS